MDISPARTHQAGGSRDRVSRPPWCGCLKFWADIGRVCKKLRKFDDAQLERQFVQHHYRSPLYFGFVTLIAYIMFIWGFAYLFVGVKPATGSNSSQHGSDIIFASVVDAVAGAACLLSGIGLFVAARIRPIREKHWDKVAQSTAVTFFVGLVLITLGYQSDSSHPELPKLFEGFSNHTHATCPGLFEHVHKSGLGPELGTIESLLCGETELGRVFLAVLVSWLGPLSLSVFGLDSRRYAPLLVTEVIINFFIVLGSYYGTKYVNHEYFFASIILLSLIFSGIVLPSLLWASMSSESAARGAWIRQQNW